MPAALQKGAMACLVCLLLPLSAIAQRPGPVAPSLSQMVRSSGYIFSGTVLAVEPGAPSSANPLAATKVTFRVEQAIRGVQAGQTLMIRQWAGLSQAGQGYRVGDRVLLFLYPPSRLGLTSPVAGPMGRLNLDHSGQLLLDQVKNTPLWATPGALTPRPPGTISISPRDLAHVLRRGGKE